MVKKATEDRPEPRWQALLALLSVAGIYTALPTALSIGPRWLLPSFLVILIIPSMVSHRMGHHSLNHILGIITNSAITVALIGSLVLLVAALPAKKEAPLALLRSAATLWGTNILVFALWYWRLDGGGPIGRQKGDYHRNFLFPQWQIEIEERSKFAVGNWQPQFIDYLFVSFNTSAAFSPTDTPVLGGWAKVLNMIQGFISITIVALLVSHAVGVL